MTSTQGYVNVSLTDAPGDYDNVWVTVAAVWFHTSSTAGPDDPGWVKSTLATPVTVDLLTLQNGNLSQMWGNAPLSNATYQQIRVFLVAPDAALTASATTQKLLYNDQVNYQDSNDTEQSSPLELVNPSKGIAVYGTFTVADGSTPNLALDFDVNRDVLPFFLGNQQDYVLKPRLAYFDLSHVGAITGSVNCANLLAAGGNGFAYNLVIKAEMPSSQGSYDVVDRETGLKVDIAGNSCTFMLFPVHVPQGSSTTNYDVLIRGRNMETMIVQGVPVNVGTTPTSGATQLNAMPLDLTMGSEYTANMPANMPVVPTGADVKFYQTLTGGPTYEVRFQGVNPFTGIFTDDEPLSASNLQVFSYQSQSNPMLVQPQPAVMGGAGAFMPYGDAPYFTRTEYTEPQPPALLVPPMSGVASFTIGALSIASPASADSISGTITVSSAGKYDSGFLIVSHDGYIVTTLPLGPVFSGNSAGGPYAIPNIPGGSSTQTFEPGLYYLHAFVWNSAHPFLTLKRLEDTAVVDLRNGSATNVDLTLD
ncbi:MAG: DUF4382 domain-containing protein [Steroidobacteraceae bacterium]